MDKQEIRVPVKGGYIVAERNPDPDYDGITVYFETSDKDVLDIVLVESKKENEYDQTDIYCYKDISNENWTDKYTIEHEDIYEVFGIGAK